MKVNKMLLQASIKIFKKWFADVVEIQTQLHTNRHITDWRGKNFWKKK